MSKERPTVHVYWREHQPATRFVVEAGEHRHTFQYRRRATAQASCCGKRRWLAYLTVQVYYDGHYYWCRDGRGCKAK